MDKVWTKYGQNNGHEIHKHKPNNGGQLGVSGFDPRPHGLLRLAKLSAHGLLHGQELFCFWMLSMSFKSGFNNMKCCSLAANVSGPIEVFIAARSWASTS